MVDIFKSVTSITENDIQVGDFVKTDFSDNHYKVYEVEDDQVLTHDNGGSFWIDIAYVVAVEKQAFNNLKKDDKKMVNINVTLNDSQIEELIENVQIDDYVEYMTMDEWNDYQSGTPATEILDSVDMDDFDTTVEYAVLNDCGYWTSSDSLIEIIEPYLDEILQEYLDNNL